jgi:cobalt-zinc-cadmium efflux system protein
VNGVTALLFARGRKGDLNVKGAFLHMAADAAVSAGVVVSGLVVLLTDWAWLDPVASLAISALILFSTWSQLRDSLNLALDKVPEGMDAGKVLAYLAALPGVTEVHDLHIWPLSTTETALTAHLVRPQAGTDDVFVHHVCDELRERFAIGHATLQIEDGDPARACQLAPANVAATLTYIAAPLKQCGGDERELPNEHGLLSYDRPSPDRASNASATPGGFDNRRRH